ncbi:hypothetical protein HYH03_010774 [Edaphochlamys debaryana]|uniref:ubiquitinyl hydrolase 1 n=1 Tax=Edaphochlamys debaryana TaxID=47281 RepID=A0A836BVP0_9CHLO|nr:hypothetical protein HYH03_010774 [Edaphochlamys debaryana]|eukprot:KAG2490856.1 hypothetical protein HYH03_010774 [Edaphochlamys debaryana]
MEDDDQLYQAVEPMDAEVGEPQVQTVKDIVQEAPASTGKPMDMENSGFYEWVLPNFAKLTDKQISETFEIGTYLWKLLCFPKQNSQPYRHVSVFLEYPEASYTPATLNPKANFKLICINHKDPTKNFSKEANHTFSQEQVDWGFSQMLPLTDVSINSGYLREDGAMVIRVEITIQRDERYLYDSRTETGYVGLKNQGATCYMNSLLQYLYNIPHFRKAVYHMPVPENDEPSKSLPVALQSLFYKLQYARSAVSTKELTKSFGWNTYDAFMQHDVQELNRVLCEKLEEKMKNTRVEKAINETFEGHTYNFIECLHVPVKSTRKESFMDLQLDVKGCRNIYDSFDKYTEVEILNGQNQYKTDDHGMQDARKGILFESLPPVLQLQLKRFEYDCQRDAMVKINDRYEFYEEIDLDRGDGKYLSPTADRSVRNVYRLHSVLVHSGGVHGGHYYGYIRPDGKQWLKFDDDRVSKEDARQALDAQFGAGDDDGYTNQQHGPAPLPLKYAKFSNAYMLVYVRAHDWPSMMCEVGKEDIVKHLRDRLEREQADKESRQRDKAEAHLYCLLKLVTDEQFKEQVGSSSSFDLCDLERLPPERCHYRLRKNCKFAEFREEVARRTGVPPARQRFWTWKIRSNGTLRPDRPLTTAEEAAQLVDLKDIRTLAREGAAGGARSALMTIPLYLEVLPEGEEGFMPVAVSPGGKGTHAPSRTGHVLVFFKVYDPVAESLSYYGHHVLSLTATAGQVIEHLNEEMEEDASRPALLFEEVKFEPTVMVEAMDPRKQLRELEMDNGDILVFQRRLGPEEEAAARYPTADAYMSYVHNRRQVHFKKLEDPQAPPVATLELLRNTSYDEVCSGLAAKLGLPDPTHLRLTRHNYFSCAPQRAPVKWRSASSLEHLLLHGQHATDTLYFEVLDLPLEEMEQLKTVKVSYHNERGEFVGEQHSLRLKKDAPVSELLAELGRRLQAAAAEATAARAAAAAAAPSAEGQEAAAPASTGGAAGPAPAVPTATEEAALQAAAALVAAGRPMRLLEVNSNKIYKIIDPADTIDAVNDGYWQLRAEFVPPDQLASALAPGDFLLHVCHMQLPPLSAAAAAAMAAMHAAGGAAAAAGPGAGANGEPMDAEGEDDADADVDGGDGDRRAGPLRGPEALKQALVEQMPGPAFGDPFIVRVHEHETVSQLKARLQVLLGVSPEDFARWFVLMVGTRPNNAWLEDDDFTEYFTGHRHQLAPSAEAAAGGQTNATLVDPGKLMLALLHDDRGPGGGGGGARRQPPSGSRYAYEKPVRIYG